MSKTLHRKENQVLIELLRDVRLEAGLTQATLSGKLGRAQSFISDVERGQRRLDLVQLRDLSIAVDMTLPELAEMFDARVELVVGPEKLTGARKRSRSVAGTKSRSKTRSANAAGVAAR